MGAAINKLVNCLQCMVDGVSGPRGERVPCHVVLAFRRGIEPALTPIPTQTETLVTENQAITECVLRKHVQVLYFTVVGE